MTKKKRSTKTEKHYKIQGRNPDGYFELSRETNFRRAVRVPYIARVILVTTTEDVVWEAK